MIETQADGRVRLVGERIGSSEAAILVLEPATGITAWLPRGQIAIREGMPVAGGVVTGQLPRIAIEVTMPAWLARQKRLNADVGAGQGRLL